MKRIRLLHIVFQQAIKRNDWAIFKTSIEQNIPLVSSQMQAYPLIQFKLQPFKKELLPMLLCIETGIEAIYPFLTYANDLSLEIKQLHPCQHTFCAGETLFNYRLEHWQPLEFMDYKDFLQIEQNKLFDLFLKPALRQHILSFLTSVNYNILPRFELTITNLVRTKWIRENHHAILDFTIDFQTNLALPHLIGLGQQAQQGLGVVKSIHNQNFKH